MTIHTTHCALRLGDNLAHLHFLRKLAAAYPADYVYAYRYAKHLLEKGDAAGALAWSEKAYLLSYGANRLAVAKVRAQAASLLKRDGKP